MNLNKVHKFLWVLCFLSVSVKAADRITTYETKYTASLYGYNLDITSNLKQVGKNKYQLSTYVDSYAGELTESSSLNWDETKKIAIPQFYDKHWSVLRKTGGEQVRFDWTKGVATNVQKQTNINVKGLVGVQDNLSYQFQMRQDFIAGKKSVRYVVTSGEKNSNFDFDIVKEEVIDSALGKVKVVKVKRIQTGNKETNVWLAKDYSYLLVKFEQKKDGILYSFEITKASLDGKEIKRF